MLKIISGSLKGRAIPYVKGGSYRPSTSKLREALFSIISSGEFASSNLLENANFLDLCSGSGAISFEAISRGAAHATLLDISRENLVLAEDTAKKFGIQDQFSFVKCNISNLPKATKEHNLVFIDPPYKEINKPLISTIFTELYNKKWLAESSVIMIEMHKTSDIESLIDEKISERFKAIKNKLYGNSKLYILLLQ